MHCQPMNSQSPRRSLIQRKRLGKVKFISEKGDYGFITAEDYRDDVFLSYIKLEAVEYPQRRAKRNRAHRRLYG